MVRATANAILGAVNEQNIWERLLRSDSERIVLETMKYLTDRRDGKPVQSINAKLGISELHNASADQLLEILAEIDSQLIAQPGAEPDLQIKEPGGETVQ